MEELAASTIPSGSSAQIQQVYDQYLNFTCSEPNMFSLNDRQSYLALNDPTAPETAIEASIDKAASSLFSVLATMGMDIRDQHCRTKRMALWFNDLTGNALHV